MLGARLSHGDDDVLLLSTDKEHIRAIQGEGLLVEELDGTVRRYRVAACDNPGAVRAQPDLVLVTVKTYSTEQAVSSVRDCCHASSSFLTLQNGVGNRERISGLVGEDRVMVGVTAQGATLVGPGRVRHGGNGPTFVGEFRGPPSSRARTAVDLFNRVGIEAHTSNQMERLIWEKLLVNVGINAITALTGILNGMIAELPPGRELSRSAVEEALLVAGARGIDVSEEIVDRVLNVARSTARNRSSMGQDVDRGKRTEIDAINGAIVQFGRKANIDTPVNQTLVHLIKILEARIIG